MLKRCLSYLLVTMVALQSWLTIADTHQIHQTGTEHLTHEQEHLHDTEQLIDTHDSNVSENSDITQYDCSHCCHCHSTGQVVLSSNQTDSFNNKVSQITSPYHFTYLSYSITPDNPPPII